MTSERPSPCTDCPGDGVCEAHPAECGSPVRRQCACLLPWLGIDGKCRQCGRHIMKPQMAVYIHELKRHVDAYFARAGFDEVLTTIMHDREGWNIRIDPDFEEVETDES